ncbi:hypothetical protein MNEG_8114 [Monoraphidium neglectum]|uniref:CDR ABC transporter domain-containing protein n=1 Tax=Monoraphidium neglectum TaxID=145388 RepID=A0A0D2KX26_9CHLO|nr:hypothetical protein MNEG_8114 [Monoraphidium neglectum]KIY99843.1 hypothetical protein MNEG_8114 [Monoraphidium neglectum]|eukprot:XP_013898863.1 hypothetical protein MNEG_8114 [Monoraphidium neglectum]
MVNQFEKNDPRFIGGKTLLHYFGVADQSAWANIGAIFGFFGVFMVFTWLVLSFRRYERR